jgi:RecB family exonuclease
MEITAQLLPNRVTDGITLTLSVSKAKTFDDCKAKYKFTYIQKLPRKDMDFHIFGKFLHYVLETFHEKLILNPTLSTDWKPVMQESWKFALTNSKKENDKVIIPYKDLLTKEQIIDARDIIKEYSEILEEEGLPNVINVEKEFYIALNGKILLNGFIDRIQIDSDGMLHVADYKTTKDPKYLKDFFQLKTYCYALMLNDPNIKRARASFILLRHNFDYLTEEYSRDEIMDYVGEKFVKYAYDIEDEKLFRPNPQFLCKYCDFAEHCKAGRDFLIKKGVISQKPQIGLRKW